MSASVVLERLPAAAQDDPASGTYRRRQRVYILPTRAGLVFCLLLLAMLFGAMNYNNSLAYALTFLLGSLFLVCMLHTHRNLAGLIISAGRPQPVYAGETAQFPINLDNRHGPARTALRLVCQPRRSQRKNSFAVTFIPTETDVGGGKKQPAYVSLPAVRRGLLPLERIMISSSFPLGLLRAWSYLEFDQRCVVYPKPAGRPELPSPASGCLQGQQGRQDGTNDFTGFRPYHPGDSVHSIAWKALAREQPLLVKRFSGDGSHTLLLQWKDTGHLHNTEERLSQLCRWILEAERQGWNYGMAIPGAHIDPGRGQRHREHCLEALARFGADRAGHG